MIAIIHGCEVYITSRRQPRRVGYYFLFLNNKVVINSIPTERLNISFYFYYSLNKDALKT